MVDTPTAKAHEFYGACYKLYDSFDSP